jgi:membrane-bound lytic murein transglycosylase F
VLSNSSFHHTPTYNALVESGVRCDSTNYSGVEMAQRLIAGRADAIICVPEEAALLTFLHRNIREVGSVEESCEVVAVFANESLRREFVGEMKKFANSEGFASMQHIYFGKSSLSEHFSQLRYTPTRVVDGISIWDEQLKSIAEKIGVDWRLMSAMAYHESRFRNDQVSHKGAVGLMQVTPIVAQEFNLNEGYDLSDPSTNITLAAKLIRRSSRALGFGGFPTSDDGKAIVVASYNCGITRTLEAQRLCELYGYNKHSWRDVAEMFRNMSSAEWISTHDYRMRRFGDAEVTIAYTEGVMRLYDSYRNTIQQ